MTPLPSAYSWLDSEPGPNMLLQLRALYGVHEALGPKDNPVILAWAAECGIPGYVHDSIAWCGLTVAVAVKRAGWDFAPGHNALWALNWREWGNNAWNAAKVPAPALGDVLVFTRTGGGHVALYVGEDATHYHILGGNQSDAICIVRKAKADLVAARRAPWRIAQPANVRVVPLRTTGAPISVKEV